jgi:tetratricopeptide (TPR) repeat protein
MARGSGLISAAETLTTAQRMTGAMLAGTWSRSANPPIGPDKAGYYSAALAGGASGPMRDRIARCLLLCDATTGQYVKTRLEWYRCAALAFPDDEPCQFYVAALCFNKVFKEPDLTTTIFQRLMRPEWEHSPYWGVFHLSRHTIATDLARVISADPTTITVERVAIVEHVLHVALEREDRTVDRRPLTAYLCAAYRQAGRKDEAAEIVYRYIFTQAPEDAENNAFLAALYHEQGKGDAISCAVYARMVFWCEKEGKASEADFWAERLARGYLGLGRLEEVNLPAFERAARLNPEDPDLQAALLCALARRRGIVPKEEHRRLLEEGLARESVYAPRFSTRHWDWSLVPRALAYAYGRMDRTDDEAMRVYARTIELCPEERDAWGFYARGLAERKEHGPEAIAVYERAFRTGQANDSVMMTLAQAYITSNAYQGEKREVALNLWETLYRQGKRPQELVDALTRAYVEEERVNEIAITLWERAVTADDKNGPLRLRLAQEYRARSEWEAAATYYREAARLMPKDFTAQYEAGVMLIEHFNDNTTAIRLLQKAVKLPAGQQHLNAHFALGEALLARDKRDEARVVFQKIVDEIDANHTKTLLHLAKLNLKYEEEGVRKAEALYEQAKSLDPNHPETYRKMAELYHAKGQADEEQEALEKYLELSEPDAGRYRQLADLYVRRGDYLRAESAIRQVIALGAGDKKLYTLLGEVILQGRLQAGRHTADLDTDTAESAVSLSAG